MIKMETVKLLFAILQMARATNSPEASWKHRQAVRLQQLVKHARQHSSLLRSHWQIADFSGVQLSDLRPIKKPDLVGRLEEHLTAPAFRNADANAFMERADNLGKWFMGNYCLYRTSGTQGSALTIVQDRATLRTVMACTSARAQAGRRSTFAELFQQLRQPKRVAFITTQPGFFPSSAATHLLPSFTGSLLELAVISIMDPDVCEQLARFRPHAVFAYAGILDSLARRGAQYGPQLEQISNSSEQLTPAVRQRLESMYKVPVVDHYGTGECLQLADTCSAGRMHVNADWAILEPVDDDLQPVASGTVSSKVLITNLANRLQPFVRYVVDDRVAIDDTTRCSCGCSFPIVTALHGRSSDQFVVQSNTGESLILPGILFQHVTEQFDDIAQWRFVQVERNRLIFEWQYTPSSIDRESMFLLVLEKLREQGVPDCVQVESRPLAGSIINPSSGKSKRIVPLPE